MQAGLAAAFKVQSPTKRLQLGYSSARAYFSVEALTPPLSQGHWQERKEPPLASVCPQLLTGASERQWLKKQWSSVEISAGTYDSKSGRDESTVERDTYSKPFVMANEPKSQLFLMNHCRVSQFFLKI